MKSGGFLPLTYTWCEFPPLPGDMAAHAWVHPCVCVYMCVCCMTKRLSLSPLEHTGGGE